MKTLLITQGVVRKVDYVYVVLGPQLQELGKGLQRDWDGQRNRIEDRDLDRDLDRVGDRNWDRNWYRDLVRDGDMH